MKKIILWLVVAAFSYHASAQGTVKINPGAKMISKNGAFMVMNNMNLVNNGSMQQSIGDGTIKLTGSSDVTLGGSGTILDNLALSKSGTSAVSLSGNIAIRSQINFQGGILNLNNFKADLGATGQLVNESESSRAFTTGTGYLEATRNLAENASINAGSLGIFIKADKALNNVIIRRGHKVQTGISNPVRRYYDIIPEKDKTLNALVRFYYFDNELNGQNESNLNIWKSSNTTSWELAGSDARNVVLNYVEKKGIGKFFRLTLAEKKVKKPLDETQQAGSLAVNAFPNPFNDFFTLQVTSGSSAPVSVRIINATGILMEERMGVRAMSSVRVGGTKYLPGVYFAEVMQGTDRVILKLIKQNF